MPATSRALVSMLLAALPCTAAAQEGAPAEAASPAAEPAPVEPTAERPDDLQTRLPIQLPIPPAPEGGTPLVVTEHGRADRFLDLATDLGEAIARDAGMMLRRSPDGRADALVWRGATGPGLGDVEVELDGQSLAVPLAGRGSDYTDLRLLPIAGIEGYSTSDEGYAGTISLRSRRLHGATGGVYIGERGARRLSLAGGAEGNWGHSLLAFETREAARPAPGMSDDRISMLASAGVGVGSDLAIDFLVRFYRDVWDEEESGGGSDGGDLRGTAAGVSLRWTPSERVQLTTSLAALDDRFGRFVTEAGQREERDRNRAGNASVELELRPELPFEPELGATLLWGYDSARRRSFATEERTRLFSTDDLHGDFMRTAAIARGRVRLSEGLAVDGELGIDQVTVRRTGMRLESPSESAADTAPVAAIGVTYEGRTLAARLAVARGSRTDGEALTVGERELQGGRRLELSTFGRAELEALELRWKAAAFASIYGAEPTSSSMYGEEALVSGAEARIDLSHRPSGLTVAARGGPLFSTVAPPGEASVAEAVRNGIDEERRAEGVPRYIVHLGLLRHAAAGIAAELWADAYGEWAESSEPDAPLHDAAIDLSARLGYRGAGWVLWLGGSGLLADDPAEGGGLPRTLFALLDVAS